MKKNSHKFGSIMKFAAGSAVIILILAGAFTLGRDTALANFVMNAYQGYKLSQELIVYYSFDGKDVDRSLNTAEVRDRSGNGNNGDWLNHATTTIAGKNGQAIDFDGVNDQINAGDINALDGLTRLTASAWVRTSSLSSELHIVDKAGCSGTTNGGVFELFGGNGTPGVAQFSIYKSGGSPATYVVNSSNRIDDGEWHLVTGVYDGSNLIIYVDAVSRGTTAASSITMPSTSFAFVVGGCDESDPTLYPWNGDIDEVRVYGRALSADEVKRLYLMGASIKMNVSHRDELTSGLVGYWTMDGMDIDLSQTTAEVRDRSGNGSDFNWLNHATSTVVGKIGQAALFDDVDDFMEDTSVSSALNITGDITVSSWIKRSAAAIGTYGGIFTKAIDNVAADFELYINGTPQGPSDVDKIGFWTSASGGQNTYSNSTIIDTDWHHVVFTRTGGTSAIYIDGRADGGTGLTNTFSNGTSRVTIGTDGPTYLSGASNFGGAIDEVRVYNRGLSADEIKRLYLMGASMKVNVTHRDELTNGLVGHWTMDGVDIDLAQVTAEVRDRSGQGNNGNWLNHATTTTIGKIGQGLSFDGNDDYVNMGDPTILDGAAEMTASIWFKVSNLTSEKHLFDKSLCSNSAGTAFEIMGGAISQKLAVGIRSGGVNTYTDGTTSIDDGNWHLAVLRYDGTTLKLYIDGREDSSTGASGAIESTADAIEIGGNCNGIGSYEWPGQADEARIYNRALSVDEIRRLYLMGK